MLGQLIKFLKLLNAEISPSQIAAGICMGMILGLTPILSLHNLLVLFLICIFRVNITGVLMGWAVFSALGFILDTAMAGLGESLLLNPDFKAFWTSCYQSDLLRLAHFNNTLTLGSLVTSLALFIPVFIVLRIFILQYRSHIKAKLDSIPLVQSLKATKLMRMIASSISATEVNS